MLASQYPIQRTALTFHSGHPIMYIRNSLGKTMAEAPEEFPNKRRSRRAKIAKPLRVRPSEPRDEHFEDMPVSVNASKEGIYFHTRRSTYYKGMRVFVTFPFTSAHDPMNCEYVAEVVRVENLPNGRFGVALHLMMTMNFNSGAPPSKITRA
jgi:hypothetical protein